MRLHKTVFLFTIILIFSLVTGIIILLQKKPTPPQSPPKKQCEPTVVLIERTTNEYTQVGIITSNETDKEPIILPLFARKLYGRSDRFQYYTTTDKIHMIHLPLQFKNRECEDRIGCEEIYSDDKLTVTSYQNREFTATIYKRY